MAMTVAPIPLQDTRPPAAAAPNAAELILLNAAHAAVVSALADGLVAAAAAADGLASETVHTFKPIRLSVLHYHFPFLSSAGLWAEVRRRMEVRGGGGSGGGGGSEEGDSDGEEKKSSGVSADATDESRGDNVQPPAASQQSDGKSPLAAVAAVTSGSGDEASLASALPPAHGLEWKSVSTVEAEKDAERDHMLDEKLVELAAFREIHGHCRVPKKSEEGSTELGKWAMKMRSEYRKMKKGEPSFLNTERLAKLISAGFVFNNADDARERIFDEKLADLAAFREVHGHCRVPIKDKEGNSELGRWAGKMRGEYRKMKRGKPSFLNKERLAKLVDSGFVFEDDAARERIFDEKLADLAIFRRVHGHCRVPIKCKEGNAELGKWVGKMRGEYRKMKKGEPSFLNAERLAKLVNVGFVFNTLPRGGYVSWEERIEACRNFKEQNGHLRIPHNHPDLASWVGGVRLMYKTKMEGGKTSLTPERQAQLDEMGFVWLAGKRRKPNDRKSWEDRFREFNEYLEREGHPYVPQHFPGGLGKWVNHQRINYKRLKSGQKDRGQVLSAEKALKLTEAGFAWDASFLFGTGKGPRDSPRSGKDGGKGYKAGFGKNEDVVEGARAVDGMMLSDIDEDDGF